MANKEDRMEKIGVLVLCTALTAGLILAGDDVGRAEQESLCIPIGILQIKAPEGADSQRSPVDFPHDVHFDYNCTTCHHMWERDAEILSCTTAGCHDVVTPPKSKDSPDRMLYFKNAYHQLCITCHKEIKQSNLKKEMSGTALKSALPNSGPTSCVECHADL
jgi:hypothetical protein